MLQIVKIGRNTWSSTENLLFQKMPLARSDLSATKFKSMQPAAVGNIGCSECVIPNADSSSTQLSQSAELITCTVHGTLYILSVMYACFLQVLW